eukprot:SAG22_NODE_1098_length_5567_cov_27.664045_4_plen_325_part_00
MWAVGRVPAAALLLPALLAAGSAPAAAGNSPTGPPGRGFGDGKTTAERSDFRLLDRTAWWYNWGLNPDPALGVFPQEFVAMAWGAKHKGEPLAARLAGWVPHRSTKHLLGFNEPNLRHQSNLTAAQACALWPTVLAAARKHKLKVGSPAANHCTPGGGGEQDSNCYARPADWFDAFFALPGCGVETVDFLATHKYGCNASDTIAYLMMLHGRYGKPVWLTEFACATGSKNQLRLMQQLVPWMVSPRAVLRCCPRTQPLGYAARGSLTPPPSRSLQRVATQDTMQGVVQRYAWYHARAKPGEKETRKLIGAQALTTIGRWYNGQR